MDGGSMNAVDTAIALLKRAAPSRLIAALKSEALLNESVGAGYIERNWPPALKESGALGTSLSSSGERS